MPRATAHIRLNGVAEEAFMFYKSVFGTEFSGPILRWNDMGTFHSCPMTEEEKNLILHIELPILGGLILSGSDAPADQGFNVSVGDNMGITLELESQEEAEFLFDALSDGGNAEVTISWARVGQYTGHLVDRYGIHWNFTGPMKPYRDTELPSQAL